MLLSHEGVPESVTSSSSGFRLPLTSYPANHRRPGLHSQLRVSALPSLAFVIWKLQSFSETAVIPGSRGVHFIAEQGVELHY